MSRKQIWDYYRVEFLDDGYPGRRVGDDVQPHPLYGPYVINDYLAQYRRTQQNQFLEAARQVADAAVARMIEFRDSLIFQYQPNTGISRFPFEFYSGLTQSRYLSSLGQLEVALGSGEYRDATSAILRSLLVPAEVGGVARRTPNGALLIEEYSHSVPDYTLNGWATATLKVHEYAETTGDARAYELFEQSVQGIAELLPLYDVGQLANSRYRLTGPAKFRFLFSHRGATILSGGVDVPGQGFYPLGADAGKWTNRFISGVDENGCVRHSRTLMEVLISRVSWPVPNRIRVEIETAKPGHVTVQVGDGSYNPIRVQCVAEKYKSLGRVALTKGRNVVDVPVPWTDVELAAYPTSFTKLIGRRRYNTYHFIHIDALDALSKLTDSETLRFYRDRWNSYPASWRDLPVYADADIVLERYKAPSST
jgi:hypothetical protein